MKFILKIFSVVLLLIIIISCLAVFLSIKLNQPPAEMPEETFFRVYEGDTAGQICENLEKSGLIKNSLYFKFYVSLKKTASQMKAGLYKIKSDSTMVDIHNILLKGSEELFKVTIPPGLTSTVIADILESEGIITAENFIKTVKSENAEGFLFPDTYSFPKNYSAKKVVEYMVNNFYENLEEIYPSYKEYDEKTFLEKIIMATIIEREYRIKEEAPIIASVFYNRIKNNMHLSSCATVVYAITEEYGMEHPERLLYKDLEIDSEYNTYKKKGLPPGPICNPGKIALDASFNPAKTDYLYFLLEDKNTGKHTFSKSYAEHNKSYNLYIKGK